MRDGPLESICLIRAGHEIQDSHPHGDPVSHLVQNDRREAIRHLGGYLHAPVDGTRMHHDGARFGQFDALCRQSVEARVLSYRGEQRATLPFQLQPQHHDDLNAAQGLIKVVEGFRSELFDTHWNHGGRSYDTDFGTELGERMNIRTSHAAVQYVSDNGYPKAFKRQPSFANRVQIE